MKSNDLTIIVPAAGIGRRMKSYGPKSLVELFTEETILSRQLSIFQSLFPTAEIIYVLGFESEKIIKKLPKTVKVVENEMYETTGPARSIGMALRVASHENVLLVYGDTVFDPHILLQLTEGPSSVAVYESGKKDEVGVIVNKDGFVENFSYISKKIWGQLAYFSKNELDKLRSLCYNRMNAMRFGFEVLNIMIDTGTKFKAIEAEYAVDIDCFSDLSLTKDVKKHVSVP